MVVPRRRGRLSRTEHPPLGERLPSMAGVVCYVRSFAALTAACVTSAADLRTLS
jgi:hypothetical protein